jgi:hypothetical protein
MLSMPELWLSCKITYRVDMVEASCGTNCGEHCVHTCNNTNCNDLDAKNVEYKHEQLKSVYY